MNEIRPQEGPQEEFLSCEADIAIYGGAAGGGKSYGLLLEPLRHLDNPDFGGVIFRRTSAQVRKEGSLWDTSAFYASLGGDPKESKLTWNFPSGVKVQFGHLEHEKNVYDWQGSQIPFMGFDELTHFTKNQFFYMVSRLRSTSGVPGYIRATTNPDARSWVREFISWWIDQETGFAIPERDGVLRYFIREGNRIIWGDSAEELKEKYGDDQDPISVTFIASKVYDNKILLEKDPKYLSKLKALDLVERSRLLYGNWNIVASAGNVFKRHWFEVIDVEPKDIVQMVRCWDRAATKVDESNQDKIDPDWTAGVKMAKTRSGYFIVLDVIWVRESTFEVEKLTLNTARQDGVECEIKIFQDPGSAGVYEANSYIKLLSGFAVKSEKIITNKETNAKPASAQAEHGIIKLLRGPWNKDFLDELVNFPDGVHDDQVDAFSGAFNYLNADNVGEFTEEIADSGSNTLTGGMAW